MEKEKRHLLAEAITKENESQTAALNSALEFLTPGETATLEQCLDFLTGQGLTLEYLASCYNVISGDTLAEQIYFLQNRKYRHSTYAEVADSVYGNKDYMEKYMYGLMLTEFLWKNHLQMNRWFEERIPRNRKGAYLEIGPGHGYHMLQAMKNCSFDTYEAIDISPTSIKLTESYLMHALPEPPQNLTLRLADFLEYDFNKKFDTIVMGEVLEHVEQPSAFIERIAKAAKPDAFIYITTAINAPAIDHIYLFDTPESVEAVVAQAGLAVKDRLLVPYKGMSLEKSLKAGLPVTIALVIG